MGGPVRASSLSGSSGPAAPSEEVLGTDQVRLSGHYFWTWYDMASAGFKNSVLVANPGHDHSGNAQGTVTAAVKISLI